MQENKMQLQDQQLDREYWNIVKGIGAVCVVIGHCWMWAQSFVYAFHMPLFFFISGYMYNEKKYGDKPYVYISKRIESSWSKFVIVSIGFIALHNVFYSFGMLQANGVDYDFAYSKTDMAVEMAKAVLGCSDELLISPMWFVPVLVLAASCFGLMVTVSRKIEKKCRSVMLKLAFQFCCVTFLGIVGYLAIARYCPMAANAQVSLAIQPYLWAGYLLRNYGKELEKYLSGVLAFICLVIVIWASSRYLISLINYFVYPFMYPLALVGIYFCLYLAKVLRKYSVTTKIFALLGRESFFLMASHFFILRLFDRVYCTRFGEAGMEYYRKLPVAFDELAPVYLILGIGIPTALYCVYDRVRQSRADHIFRKR